MCEIIKQGIRKSGKNCNLNEYDLWLSKNGNGINIKTCYDEIEITQELQRMDQQHKFDYNFKMPKFIKKFREPEIN